MVSFDVRRAARRAGAFACPPSIVCLVGDEEYDVAEAAPRRSTCWWRHAEPGFRLGTWRIRRGTRLRLGCRDEHRYRSPRVRRTNYYLDPSPGPGIVPPAFLSRLAARVNYPLIRRPVGAKEGDRSLLGDSIFSFCPEISPCCLPSLPHFLIRRFLFLSLSPPSPRCSPSSFFL